MSVVEREGRRPWADDDERFQAEHRSVSDRIERLLMQMIVLGLVALVLVQTFHTNAQLRRILSYADRMEGVDWATALDQPRTVQSVPQDEAAIAVARPRVQPSITIVLASQRSAPGVKLLVGGKVAGDFTGGSVTAAVTPGTELAIDARSHNGPLRFWIVAAPGLSQPRPGQEWTAQGNILRLGTARGNQ